MSYMRKNVNFFLLFVIVVIVISLVGLTTYYEKTYKNLSSSYDTKLDEINRLLENLNQERRKLNETTYDLTIQKDREKDLSGQYLDVRLDLNATQSQLDTTKANLDSTQAALDTTENALASAKQQVDSLVATVATQKSTINKLESDKSSLRSERDSLASQLSACQST